MSKCLRHTECLSGFCKDGYCNNYPQFNEPCKIGHCPPDLLCDPYTSRCSSSLTTTRDGRCILNSSCPLNQHCVQGRCVPRKQVGEPCSWVKNECDDGLECTSDENKCRARCFTDVDCIIHEGVDSKCLGDPFGKRPYRVCKKVPDAIIRGGGGQIKPSQGEGGDGLPPNVKPTKYTVPQAPNAPPHQPAFRGNGASQINRKSDDNVIVTGWIIAGAAGLVVILIFAFLIYRCCCKPKNKKKSVDNTNILPNPYYDTQTSPNGPSSPYYVTTTSPMTMGNNIPPYPMMSMGPNTLSTGPVISQLDTSPRIDASPSYHHPNMMYGVPTTAGINASSELPPAYSDVHFERPEEIMASGATFPGLNHPNYNPDRKL